MDMSWEQRKQLDKFTVRRIRALFACSEILPKMDKTLVQYSMVIDEVAAQLQPFTLEFLICNYQKAARVTRTLHEKGLLGRNSIGRTNVYWWTI